MRNLRCGPFGVLGNVCLPKILRVSLSQRAQIPNSSVGMDLAGRVSRLSPSLVTVQSYAGIVLFVMLGFADVFSAA